MRQLVVVDGVGGGNKVLVIQIEKNSAKTGMFVFDYFNTKCQSTISTLQPVVACIKVLIYLQEG